ncbi:N-acetylmuramoyl-L-alanine amidase [Alkalibacterium sp. f15]|uniref:N-acetylmuramoyl-L-alanine amidase n=1 Tax=Alkalibacterium sp. f15 TaxID=3414029 RepID=UPI003BF8D1A6
MEYIDRRNIALGGQRNQRTIESIFNIGIHYTAVLGFITGHENFWRTVRLWGTGGYVWYIDRDGKIYRNYNYERITHGATGWNATTVHVSVEARNKNDYTPAQMDALEEVIKDILNVCPNTSPDRIFGHYEMTPTTACPGWNKAELNDLRRRVKTNQPLRGMVTKTTIIQVVSKTVAEIAQEVINGLWGNGAERMRALSEAGHDAQLIQQHINDLLKPGTKEEVKPLNVIAQEVLDGKWGNGLERSESLKKAGYNPAAVQLRVNELAAPPKPQLKELDVIAREVIEGKWGSGQYRFDRLNKAGYSSQQVQQRVNQIVAGQRPQTKSIEVLAQEVIDGKHGSGDARRKSLGSLYTPVQNLVNQMLRATPQASQKKSIEQMAREVIAAKHGNGHVNRRKSLGISQVQYEQVKKRVNQLAR